MSIDLVRADELTTGDYIVDRITSGVYLIENVEVDWAGITFVTRDMEIPECDIPLMFEACINELFTITYDRETV